MKKTSLHCSAKFAAVLAIAAFPFLAAVQASAEPKRINEQEGLRSVVQRVSPVYPPMANS